MSQELLIAFSALASVMVVALTALAGWQGWLSLKLRELDAMHGTRPDIETGSREGAARIEIADLKERIRKLEAIANGVDL